MAEFRAVPPHILLITCHDIGRHLGCYGLETVRTEHLDSLAAGGVRFAQAYCTSPGCSPARASIATGRYPHSNGVMGLTHPPFGWDLGPDERHLAKLLGRAGYETHLFGHQHVTPDPSRLGFDHLHGFDRLLEYHGNPLGDAVSAGVAGFLANRDPDRPLYIEVNLEEAHRPYDQGGAVSDEDRGVFIPRYLPADEASYDEMAAFQGAVRRADTAIGRILAALREAGLENESLVVFTTDHGVAMPRAKGTLYDPGISVSLLVRWPSGEIRGGRTVRGMVSTMDILPSLLDVVGVSIPPEVQGRSFLPLLRGATAVGRERIYAEKTFHSYYDPMRAVRTERFKYIRNFETAFRVEVPGDVQNGAIFRSHAELYSGGEHPPVELYDLGADSLEQENLAGQSDLAAEEQQLNDWLWRWMEETADPLLKGPVPSPAYRHAMEQHG